MISSLLVLVLFLLLVLGPCVMAILFGKIWLLGYVVSVIVFAVAEHCQNDKNNDFDEEDEP